VLSEDDFRPLHCQTAAAEDAVAAAVEHAVAAAAVAAVAAAAEHAVAAAAEHAVAAAVAAAAAAVAASAVAKTHDSAQQLLVELKQALQTQHPHHVPLSLVSQQHHAWPAAEGLLT